MFWRKNLIFLEKSSKKTCTPPTPPQNHSPRRPHSQAQASILTPQTHSLKSLLSHCQHSPKSSLPNTATEATPNATNTPPQKPPSQRHQHRASKAHSPLPQTHRYRSHSTNTTSTASKNTHPTPPTHRHRSPLSHCHPAPPQKPTTTATLPLPPGTASLYHPLVYLFQIYVDLFTVML